MDRIWLNSTQHNSNLMNSLDHFKAVNSFVDVTLVCEGHTVKAHQVVLSAGSNVMHRLLLANPADHPIIILAETKYETLRTIMDFLYKGRIDIQRSDLRKVLAAADAFEINELRRLCEEKLNGVSNSHPSSKSTDSSRSPSRKKKKRHHRLSSDSDISCDAIFPKRESSHSPCRSEQPKGSAATHTECDSFCPQIADTRSLNNTSVGSSCDLQDESQRKDATTEIDVQCLEEVRSSRASSEIARVKVRPRYTEKSDDSDVESPCNKSSFLSKRRRAPIWAFYTPVNKNYAVCKVCRHKLSYKTTVTNLTKHVVKKHRQFDVKRPPKLPDLPLLTIQKEQLEIFEEIDFNSVEEESATQDDSQLHYEEASGEIIPSTSTPYVLKIT